MVLLDSDLRACVRSRLEAAEARASRILAPHQEHLEIMAGVLARERLLTGDTLAQWLMPVKLGNEVQAELIAGRSIPLVRERDKRSRESKGGDH